MSTRYTDRDYDARDRDDDRYGRRSEYAYGGSYGEPYRRDHRGYGAGRDYGYGRESDYDLYGREGYYGSSYGARYGGGYDYDRGRYGEPYYSGRGDEYDYSRYGYSEPYVERYGSAYGTRYGRGYDYDRYGYGRGSDYGRYGRGYGERYGGERGWWDRATDEVASWFGDEEAERRRRRDEYRAGEYRGRGPRGYRRSDDRIKEDVNDRLTDDPYLDASDVEVSVDNGEVTLSGTVESRTAKRRAEDIAESVSGVTNVQNNLRVGQATTTGTTGTATASAGKARTATT